MTDKIYDKAKATPDAWRDLAEKQMRGGSLDDLDREDRDRLGLRGSAAGAQQANMQAVKGCNPVVP